MLDHIALPTLTFCALVCLLLPICSARAEASSEANPMLATVDRAATITVQPAAGNSAGNFDAGRSHQVIISVVGFTPSQDKDPVQFVVKASNQEGGHEKEIGRFGILPATKFRADNVSKAERFSFKLPVELATGRPVRLTISVVPSNGRGLGARLEVGGAELR